MTAFTIFLCLIAALSGAALVAAWLLCKSAEGLLREAEAHLDEARELCGFRDGDDS